MLCDSLLHGHVIVYYMVMKSLLLGHVIIYYMVMW